jgi:hypothetical protein
MECKDDPSFLYNDKAGYTCQFLGKMYPEKCSKSHNGTTIGVSSCPESCKMVKECLESTGVSVNETVTSYKADDLPTISNEQVSVGGNAMKNISMSNTTVELADWIGKDAGKKVDTTAGVGTKSMADEIDKDDFGISDEGGFNGKTNQLGYNSGNETRNDDNAQLTNGETKSMADELDHDDRVGNTDFGSLGGHIDFQDISQEFESSVRSESGNAGDTDDGNYSSPPSDVAEAHDDEEENGELHSDRESTKEIESSTNEDGANKYLNTPTDGARDDWSENKSGIDHDTKFDSTGDGAFQGGDISFSHGQEIKSVDSVPLPSPNRNVDGNDWGNNDDDDGLPLGVFAALLALLVFFVYRKSQHRQQRDCSRGTYHRVQADSDKRDQ